MKRLVVAILILFISRTSIGDMSFTTQNNACGTNMKISRDEEERCLYPKGIYEQRRAIFLGINSLSENDLRNALIYFEKCSQKSKTYNSLGLYGECAFFKGVIYLEQKKWTEALVALNDAQKSSSFIDRYKVTNNYTYAKSTELIRSVKLELKKEAQRKRPILYDL